MPIMTPFPATPSMDEPCLQGFTEMDELCFSPVWRKDYGKLNRYRIGTYFHYYIARILSHPLGFLAMLLRMLTRKCRTKGEMTARRMIRDLYDKARSLGTPGVSR